MNLQKSMNVDRHIESEQLWNEFETARVTGLSVANLRRRRLLKQPPPFVKLGARVLYRPSDVRSLIERSVVNPTKDPAKGDAR